MTRQFVLRHHLALDADSGKHRQGAPQRGAQGGELGGLWNGARDHAPVPDPEALTGQLFQRAAHIVGLGHAVSTVFNATWDSLTALEQWAERDTAPSGQTTVDTVGVPGRSRPLCDYPQWPRYSGAGDVNAAASFVCVN